MYLKKFRKVDQHMGGLFHSADDIKTAGDNMFTSTTLNKVVGDGEVEVALGDFGMMFVQLESDRHGCNSSPGRI